MRGLEGKTVYITGAARGLGAALAAEAVQRGARLGLIDCDGDRLHAVASRLEAAAAVAVITRRADVDRAIGELHAGIGPCDILINNAGITHIGAFKARDVDAIRRVMDVNLFGSIYTTAACLDSIRQRRGGIIAVSSVAGFAPLIGRTGYAASKHALHGFFDVLRLELRNTGVRVCVVCPSFIATDIRRHVPGVDTASNGRSRTVGEQADPADVAIEILDGYLSGRTLLPVGRVARWSWRIRRWSPRLYERLMLRRIRDEN